MKGNRIKKNRKKNQDLARKISRTWRAKTKVIPVVVVVLGVIPKNLSGDLKEIGIPNRVRTLQKSALLGTTTIVRKVLGLDETKSRKCCCFQNKGHHVRIRNNNSNNKDDEDNNNNNK